MASDQEVIKAPNTDYFANRLLTKLDFTDPIDAAYEAQVVSREVGFDFADFQGVVVRALDEVRETKEAFAEDGPEGREHFGDEIADIMFSLINLGRHAGLANPASMDGLIQHAALRSTEYSSALDVIDSVGTSIVAVAQTEQSDPDGFAEEMAQTFANGMGDCIALAQAHGFEPKDLLRDNVRKYLIRCQAIEQLASRDGKQWADLAANQEIITYWKNAKALLG